MSGEKPKYVRKKCEHGKYPYLCKVCGGSCLCEHGKQKYYCKECGGKGICEHGTIKYNCIKCDGKGICEHDKRRSRCVECKGGSICEHNKVKSRCLECGGSEICEHGRRTYDCVDCEGNGICEHNIRRSRCAECEGSEICEHKNNKYICVECHGKHICEHNKLRYQCVDCKGERICEHDTRRNICIICSPEIACQHCQSVSTISSNYKPYCFRCFCVLNPDYEIPRKFKLKEHYVRDALIGHFQDTITMTFDKIIKEGCSRRRPDVSMDFGSHCLIVEIDENKHSNYSCEQKRMLEIYEDVRFRKIVFVRFNPDSYKLYNKNYISPFNYTKTGIININKKEMERRSKILIDRIEYYRENEPDSEFTIDFMFYGDSKQSEYDNFHTIHTS
jgi:hypothetical protein